MKPFFALLIAFVVSGCSSVGDTRYAMANNHMNQISNIEEISPGALTEINEAPGFAVFSTAEVNLLVVSTGTGHGAVYNNETGERTYMDVFESGVGVGIGGKDVNTILVFNTMESLERFTEEGWIFDNELDASGNGSVVNGEQIGDITLYQSTKTGVNLHAMLKGTRFSKSEDLN